MTGEGGHASDRTFDVDAVVKDIVDKYEKSPFTDADWLRRSIEWALNEYAQVIRWNLTNAYDRRLRELMEKK